LGKKLTEYELKLYEYSAYSLSEEIDLFYTSKINDEFAKIIFDEDLIKEKIQIILEVIE
jgi:hypothetical protein